MLFVGVYHSGEECSPDIALCVCVCVKQVSASGPASNEWTGLYDRWNLDSERMLNVFVCVCVCCLRTGGRTGALRHRAIMIGKVPASGEPR